MLQCYRSVIATRLGDGTWCLTQGLGYDEILSIDEHRELIMGLIKFQSNVTQDEIDNINQEKTRNLKIKVQDETPPKSGTPNKVYIMLDSHSGYYKIGSSRDPKVRESTLQSEKPATTLLYFKEADLSVEKLLHRKYKNKRVRGEWFDLTFADLREIRDILEEDYQKENN